MIEVRRRLGPIYNWHTLGQKQFSYRKRTNKSLTASRADESFECVNIAVRRVAKFTLGLLHNKTYAAMKEFRTICTEKNQQCVFPLILNRWDNLDTLFPDQEHNWNNASLIRTKFLNAFWRPSGSIKPWKVCKIDRFCPGLSAFDSWMVCPRGKNYKTLLWLYSMWHVYMTF